MLSFLILSPYLIESVSAARRHSHNTYMKKSIGTGNRATARKPSRLVAQFTPKLWYIPVANYVDISHLDLFSTQRHSERLTIGNPAPTQDRKL